MDHESIIQEALSSGQKSKVTRTDMTTGIFTCSKLLYLSDIEDDDNLQHDVHGDNLQDAIGGPEPVEAFQSLEPIFNPQFDQNADQVRRIMALCKKGNPLLKDEDLALPEKPSNMEWIEYLVKKGPTILTAPKNRKQTSKILRKLGGEIKVLPPGNIAEDLTDWTGDRSQWQKHLSALASELFMVEEGCSSEVRDAGVFVLTNFQYPALLELMAQEIEKS